ncbi:hypothetical protein SAMN05216228_11602 [Rhizobium tibeticum]|uniref:Uncharacterized protein n=1 Tax=Rhizobium tibeticum TaxID=501024 RepID=A0ABY1AZC3_9HYPH|nr:hypothetical protein SAMN05216228_11602 [Rhizobium tibeticum]
MSLVSRHSNFGGIAAAEDEDAADNQSATFGVRTSAVAATSFRDFPVTSMESLRIRSRDGHTSAHRSAHAMQSPYPIMRPGYG